MEEWTGWPNDLAAAASLLSGTLLDLDAWEVVEEAFVLGFDDVLARPLSVLAAIEGRPLIEAVYGPLTSPGASPEVIVRILSGVVSWPTDRLKPPETRRVLRARWG